MYEGKDMKYLHDFEMEALYKAIAADTSRHRMRNLAIFCLARYCGLRASEVGMIRITDVNLDRSEIYIKRLKNSNNHTLRIVDKHVLSALADYMDQRKALSVDSDVLFISQKGNPISRKRLDELIKKYCCIAGIPRGKAHMHVLKHTCAVSMAEAGLDTKEVQYWIGHKSIKNTEIYLQFTSAQQDVLYQKLALHTSKNNTDGRSLYYDTLSENNDPLGAIIAKLPYLWKKSLESEPFSGQQPTPQSTGLQVAWGNLHMTVTSKADALFAAEFFCQLQKEYQCMFDNCLMPSRTG